MGADHNAGNRSDGGHWLRQTVDATVRWGRHALGIDNPADPVMHAAHSDRKVHFSHIEPTPAAQREQIQLLANQFDHAIRTWPGFHADFRQWPSDIISNGNHMMVQARLHWFGGAGAAERVVTAHSRDIDSVYSNHGHNIDHLVPANLVRAVMFVENNYNGGPGGRTALPMNVNFRVWQHAFDSYNRAHPDAPITERGVWHDSRMNILAGTIVISTINASIDPSIQGAERWALVASMYGSTEHTLQAGRPIMYGGKVEQVMEQIEQRHLLQPTSTPQATTAHVDDSHLMNLQPLGPNASARNVQLATR